MIELDQERMGGVSRTLQKIPLQDFNFNTEGLRTLFFYAILFLFASTSAADLLLNSSPDDLDVSSAALFLAARRCLGADRLLSVFKFV
jgi:hypothetical protein